jgi:hypothetical protein
MFGSTRVIAQRKYNELEPGDIFIVERLGVGNNPYEVYSIWWMFNHPSPPDGSILFSPLTDVTINDVVYKHENLYVKSASPFNKLDSEEIDKEFKFYTVDCEDYPYIIKDFINQRGKPVILHHPEEGEKMEPRHVNEGEDNMSKSDMNTAGYATVEPCETPTEHAYSDKAVQDLLSSVNNNLSTICKWMKSVDDRITILEKRERFKENLSNQLDLHDDEDKSALIEASRIIEGYFDCLADDGFPIIPWSDEIACIPANTKHYDYDPELDEFKENGDYTDYPCLVKIKSIMHNNGIVWGSIANGVPDELTWFNLTRIKDSFTINDTTRAVDCIYKIGDDDIEPVYLQTYYYDPDAHEFFKGEKKDMGGLKDITITATNITKIDDNPVALAKLRCRDDEDFTGTWIEFSELDMMR